jgi:hypothetical protein
VFLLQDLERRRIEQMRAELTTAAEGPEKPIGVRKLAYEGLRLHDLGDGAGRIGHPPKRRAVGHGVIADPVPLGVGALGERAACRIGKLGPEYEERGGNAVLLEYVEHARRDRRLRAVVEAEGDLH